MQLYEEIVIKYLGNIEMQITFPGLKINAIEIVELECYKTLQKIKNIMDNDSLDDVNCFLKIEEIICLFEQLGSNGGNRHDF